MTTLIEIYNQLPLPAQATVNQIIQESRKSEATKSFVLNVAQTSVLPTVVKCHPDSEVIQSALISGIPVDLRTAELDWDMIFDLLDAQKVSWFLKLVYPIFQPMIGMLLGIKIPDHLKYNREQRLIFGKWLAIASLLFMSEEAAKTKTNR